jgi:hypothetical protein
VPTLFETPNTGEPLEDETFGYSMAGDDDDRKAGKPGFPPDFGELKEDGVESDASGVGAREGGCECVWGIGTTGRVIIPNGCADKGVGYVGDCSACSGMQESIGGRGRGMSS